MMNRNMNRNIKRPITKAKAIDLKKDKLVLGGLALLAGLMAAAFFSTSVHAQTVRKWLPHGQGENSIKIPFQLNTQKLSH
jgi:hypothetical protein